MDREFVPPYIFVLNPDYVAARSLRSLRNKHLTAHPWPSLNAISYISNPYYRQRLCGFISSRQWFFKVMLPKIPLKLKDEAQLIYMQYITLFPFKLKKNGNERPHEKCEL